MERNHLVLDDIIDEAYNKTSPSCFDDKSYIKALSIVLLKRIGYSFKLSSPTPIQKLLVLLGIGLDFKEGTQNTAHATREEEGEWHIELSSDQKYEGNSRQWLTERGRFSVAHEIGHVVIDRILRSHINLLKQLSLTKSNNIERYCDIFSSELLLPTCIFNSVSLAEVEDITSEKRSKDSLIGFTFSMLEKLRKMHRVSRMVLLRSLDKTSLLDESETGIIISVYRVNVNTGKSPSLRIYKTSLPSWGFLPQNITLSKIGLVSAINAYNSLKYGERVEWCEIIKVNEKRVITKANENKWESRNIESCGEHSLYPLSNKDSYLVTLFKWSRARDLVSKQVELS
jgi:Zn-dependent peptidase ImmA (M78 family)